MWVWGAVAAASVAGIAGWWLVRLRRALRAERAARFLSDAAWARELRGLEEERAREWAEVEADIAEFVAAVRATLAEHQAREGVLAEAGAVVDRAWARQERWETDGGGSDG